VSRAAHASHPEAGSSPVTHHHDQDIPAVIKATRRAGSAKIPAPCLSLSAHGVMVILRLANGLTRTLTAILGVVISDEHDDLARDAMARIETSPAFTGARMALE
jgi:hypothetical protein